MGKARVSLTLTKKEQEHMNKRALAKGKSLYKNVQSELNKIIGGIAINELSSCAGDKERCRQDIDLPPRLWKTVVCVSTKLGISPTQLVYGLIVAPHLLTIIKEGDVVAGSIDAI